jgi:hypothetical protein
MEAAAAKPVANVARRSFFMIATDTPVMSGTLGPSCLFCERRGIDLSLATRS